MRTQSNDSYAREPGNRERAKLNEAYAAEFYGAYGYGAHHWLAFGEGEFGPAHQNAWNTVADGDLGVGDNYKVGADTFEGASEEGAAQIRRTDPGV
ncbi:hypothetical protein [Nocardia sp. NPDC019395]|uniref:hypothetical protein n=1 Tax=Nocardia sp. NPDC019395 TaxID=3154686 RepID=UPI0033F4F35A